MPAAASTSSGSELDPSGLIEQARQAAGRGPMCLLETGGAPGGSLLFAAPDAIFTSKNGAGELRWRSGASEPADGDPFRVLDRLLAAHPDRIAAGYWGYDLHHHLERLPRVAVDDLALPDCWVGLYRTVTRAPAQPSADEAPCVPAALLPSVVSRTSRPQYLGAVRRVLEYIGAGDCYQVNLSQRFTAPYAGTAWTLYEQLRRASPAPYAAFLNCGDHEVLSSSPELFLKVRDGWAETRPIKGTRPRGATPDEDAARADELLRSEKDRAELLMIVDLERNDLGRSCEYGSVHVPELFRLESFSHVHHLVATVRGRLRVGTTPLECLRAAFPGGSITGAPKIRAMEIIEELEPVCRGVYSGAIGWVDARGNAEWNIAIRTMVVRQAKVHFHVGGGVVADSDPEAEYEETLAKARGMLAALAAATPGSEATPRDA